MSNHRDWKITVTMLHKGRVACHKKRRRCMVSHMQSWCMNKPKLESCWSPGIRTRLHIPSTGNEVWARSHAAFTVETKKLHGQRKNQSCFLIYNFLCFNPWRSKIWTVSACNVLHDFVHISAVRLEDPRLSIILQFSLHKGQGQAMCLRQHVRRSVWIAWATSGKRWASSSDEHHWHKLIHII